MPKGKNYPLQDDGWKHEPNIDYASVDKWYHNAEMKNNLVEQFGQWYSFSQVLPATVLWMFL